MNKIDLINLVVKDTGAPPKLAAAVVNAALHEIRSAVIKGDSVKIAGFGVFEAQNRRARKGRNPRTGEEIPVAARRAPAFRAATRFKEAVRTRDTSRFEEPEEDN